MTKTGEKATETDVEEKGPVPVYWKYDHDRCGYDFSKQKGQIYQIMGYGDGFANGLELTGTKVRALVQGKPFATT